MTAAAWFVLRTGERLLWEGRPDQLRYAFNPMLLFFMAFFSVWFVGFFVTVSAPDGRSQPPAVFFLFPLVFFTVFFFGPVLIGGWLEASRARYAVTDRRILIDGWRRRAELDLTTLPLLELQRSIFGTATISFGPRHPYESFGAAGWWGGRSAPAFRAVRDADNVYELISKARVEARAR